MVKIKFIAQGANSQIGGFSHGDIARVSEGFARHLVEEARVAVYDTPAPPVVVASEIPTESVRRKAKKINKGV